MVDTIAPIGSTGSDSELLDVTLGEAKRDAQTSERKGRPKSTLLHGQSLHRSPTHTDDRGSLTEVFDVRWRWHPDPLVHAYYVTWRPGYAKGWSIHLETEDRYYLLKGELEVVMYDVRPDSPTLGSVCRLVLSDRDHFIFNIPPGIWHGSRNLGSDDAYVINFKTRPYEHENPDKYRLPLDSPLIPYSFGDAPGW